VDILCAQTLSNSDIHGNQNVLQINGPVLTPTILALMPGKSEMPFCKAGAKLARINAYFFLQCVFCVICVCCPFSALYALFFISSLVVIPHCLVTCLLFLYGFSSMSYGHTLFHSHPSTSFLPYLCICIS